ncbi:MAG: cation:proton antiporter [Planctomycetota bacterium]
MPPELIPVALAGILALGVFAQWLAWRLKLPSILLLLLAGFLVGPLTGWLDPKVLLGDLMHPLISLGVGVILFEGGLTLKTAELGKIGGIVLRLCTAGVVITWVLATFLLHLLVQLPLPLAFSSARCSRSPVRRSSAPCCATCAPRAAWVRSRTGRASSPTSSAPPSRC